MKEYYLNLIHSDLGISNTMRRNRRRDHGRSSGMPRPQVIKTDTGSKYFESEYELNMVTPSNLLRMRERRGLKTCQFCINNSRSDTKRLLLPLLQSRFVRCTIIFCLSASPSPVHFLLVWLIFFGVRQQLS